MRHVIFCIALGALLLGPASARAAASYNGTWSFSMRAVQTDCDGVTVGTTTKTLDLLMTQAKKVLTAVPAPVDPPITGVTESYRGYITKHGILMSLAEDCPVVPDPVCATGSDSFNFLDASKSSTKVVWLSITRNANSELTCSTVYSGTAKKKKSKPGKGPKK